MDPFGNTADPFTNASGASSGKKPVSDSFDAFGLNWGSNVNSPAKSSQVSDSFFY